MSYPYSQSNRLEEPHSYMYTPFQGEKLLRSYQASRMEFLRRYREADGSQIAPDHMLADCALPELVRQVVALSPDGKKMFRVLANVGDMAPSWQAGAADGSLAKLAVTLGRQEATGKVATLELLRALTATQLVDADNTAIKVWLDRLVQRFEVTKKLYDSYLPGFRRGEGSNSSVRLYWLFALSLSLFYARTGGIKYLSTLLKVCDLLCSLPEQALQGHIPERGLGIVLATEVAGVQLLAERKGVAFASE